MGPGGEGGGNGANVINDKLLKHKEKTQMREPPPPNTTKQDVTYDVQFICIVFTKNLKSFHGRYAHFGVRVSPRAPLSVTFETMVYLKTSSPKLQG